MSRTPGSNRPLEQSVTMSTGSVPTGLGGMPVQGYGTSAVSGGQRFNTEQISTISHSGLSAGGSLQPTGPVGHNTVSMQYQPGQIVHKGAQPHFIAVTTSRTRMPLLQKEEIKVESEEQAMDTSGPSSNMAVGSDVASGEASSSGGSQSEQRLKVEDALNYLDQVKYRFGNQPQVYNDFLDIMKEFKSQSIDTPGVIARVSHLFRGHPELIVGFNTFLPPGYKIEIQANDSISLSMIGQGGGYVVTTVQPGLPGPNSHPPAQSTVIHQHSSAPAAPIRPPISNLSTSSGRMSPIPPALPTAATSVNTAGTSAFTHSFTSPFVQSAFPSLQTQPVEFNHAINYVNKIKNRFQGHPDKYKQFLEILHTYQKEQRNIKDGHPPSNKHLTEHEVYSQVAKLFENQEDLLKEFGQFLPDATNHQNTSAIDQAKKSVKMSRDREFGTAQPSSSGGNLPQKRPALQPAGAQDRKKPKELTSVHYGKNVTLVEAARYGTLNDFAFFDKVRAMMKSPIIYSNFLRCINLFSDQLLSANELLTLVNPFLAKSPELHNWFKEFIGVKPESASGYFDMGHPTAVKSNEKLTEEQMVEIDYTTCKRLGASYCAMPSNNIPPKCSGRSLLPLCNEVLNDVWVSFPSWSEDPSFSNSRKTTFEECMFRVEDERFELDVVIETNAAVIRAFEYLTKKMERMSSEELSEFQLDDCLGGNSQTIHQRAIRRIYGDKAAEMIEGLKKLPATAVPLILRRLKAKEEEWRDAQKQFNKAWTEQTEKFYLKSLDLQGITFKQTDVRTLRSKALLNEIESLFDERQDRMISDPIPSAPHLTLLYRDRNLLDDACLLLLHHVRRQASIHKEDKRKIKQLLKHFVADLFHHTRMDLSDDEDEGSHDGNDGRRSPHEPVTATRKRNGNGKKGNGKAAKKDMDDDGAKEPSESQPGPSTASVWSELTKQKKLSTAHESQESRRTIAKRELKLLLSDAKAHELTDVGRTSLRDKVNREYLSEMSKDDNTPGTNPDQPSTTKRRVARRSFSQGPTDGTAANRRRMENPGPTGQRNVVSQNPDEDEEYSLFFANSKLYVFLRLHQILCERLSKIHERAVFHFQEYQDMEKNSVADYLRLIPPPVTDVSNYYQHFLELIRSLLDGNIEGSAYEDTLREMFGIHAYIAYTMDKVVSNAVRQLQGIMTDEASLKCLELFHQAGKRNGNGGFFLTMANRAAPETLYQKQVEKLCGEETCVKIMIFKKHCRMTMELLECDTPSEEDHDQKAKYSNYVTKFLKPDSSIPESIMSVLGANPVFLARNVRKWRKKNLLEWKSDNAKRNQSAGVLNVVKIDKGNTDLVEGASLTCDETMELEMESESVHTGDSLEISSSQRVIGSEESIENSGFTLEVAGSSTKIPECSGSQPNRDYLRTSSPVGGDQLVMKSVEKSQNERTVEFLMQENLQCQFNLSSYRMVYLTNSEDCIYLKGAMQRARKTHQKLSTKLSNKFRAWHHKWITANVPESLTSIFGEFLLDKNNAVSPRKTSRKSVSRSDRPPYRKYHKYVLEKE